MVKKWGWTIIGLELVLFAAAHPGWAATETGSWITYQTKHEEKLDSYGRNLASICVFAYDFDDHDNIRPAKAWVDETLHHLMGQRIPGRPVYITIVNDIETNPPQQHNGELVLRIVSDPVKRAEHIRQIVLLSSKADGVDIDYESLLAGTRGYYSQFIKELRGALPRGKLLSVVCQPKTNDDDGSRGQAIDWRAIAPHVDVLKAMTYYFSYGGSRPGPSAPLDKVRAMARLAASEVPKEKLHMVLTQFGWDWPENGPGRFIQYEKAVQIAKSRGVAPFRDPDSQTMRINYIDENGTSHEVWFPDRSALQAQIRVIQEQGIRKIDVWELGVGDPDFWTWFVNGAKSLDQARGN